MRSLQITIQIFEVMATIDLEEEIFVVGDVVIVVAEEVIENFPAGDAMGQIISLEIVPYL